MLDASSVLVSRGKYYFVGISLNFFRFEIDCEMFGELYHVDIFFNKRTAAEHIYVIKIYPNPNKVAYLRVN